MNYVLKYSFMNVQEYWLIRKVLFASKQFAMMWRSFIENGAFTGIFILDCSTDVVNIMNAFFNKQRHLRLIENLTLHKYTSYFLQKLYNLFYIKRKTRTYIDICANIWLVNNYVYKLWISPKYKLRHTPAARNVRHFIANTKVRILNVAMRKCHNQMS